MGRNDDRQRWCELWRLRSQHIIDRQQIELSKKDWQKQENTRPDPPKQGPTSHRVNDSKIHAAHPKSNVLAHNALGMSFSLHFSAITLGLFGFAVYSFKLLERGFMPARIRIEHIPVSQTRAFLRLGITLGGLPRSSGVAVRRTRC